MNPYIRMVWPVALLLICVLAAEHAAAGAAGAPSTSLAALDGGQAVVPRVLVTALTVTRSGTIYAGGIYVVPNLTPYANRPITLLGSVWLSSHDHGATWAQRVSTTDPRAFPRSGLAPWRNHHALPIDFTPAGITVDRRNPQVIYVAGCADTSGRCAYPLGGPMVAVSRDGGGTWQTALSLATIVKTPELRRAYRFGGAVPTQGYAVVFDPHNSADLYAAVSGLGVLRSTDAGRTWRYARQPQSNQTVRPCELLFDPRHPNTLYELDRAGALYRTTDAGAHWSVRSALNRVVGGSVADLTFVGRSLYVTAAKGLYASTDGGAHWRLASPVLLPGGFLQSVRGAYGWIAAFGPRAHGPVAGLYVQRDGSRWQAAANTFSRGPAGYGSLDFHAMDADLATRLWEDHAARIVFTAGPLGGLYRWRSSV